MSKPKLLLVPFDQDGSLLHYADERDHQWHRKAAEEYGDPLPPWVENVEWRPNEPFERVLRIEGSKRGRSAAYLVWKDETGATFPMFLIDIVGLIQEGRTVHGIAAGWWKVSRRGLNYGIQFISEQNPDST